MSQSMLDSITQINPIATVMYHSRIPICILFLAAMPSNGLVQPPQTEGRHLVVHYRQNVFSGIASSNIQQPSVAKTNILFRAPKIRSRSIALSLPRRGAVCKAILKFLMTLSLTVTLLFPSPVFALRMHNNDSSYDRTIMQTRIVRKAIRPSVGATAKAVAAVAATSGISHSLLVRRKKKSRDKEDDSKQSKLEKMISERDEKVAQMDIVENKLAAVEDKKASLVSPPEHSDSSSAERYDDDNEQDVKQDVDGKIDDHNGEVLPESRTLSQSVHAREDRAPSSFPANNSSGLAAIKAKKEILTNIPSAEVQETENRVKVEADRVASMTKQSDPVQAKAGNTACPLRDSTRLKTREQPKPPSEEEAMAKRYAQISSVSDRAFQILLDLGMIEPSVPSNLTKFEEGIDMGRK